MYSIFIVFVAVAAFTADAALLPYNGFLGNGFYGSNLLTNGGISVVPGSTITFAPASAIKIMPNPPAPRVLQSPTDLDLFSPAPNVRCICSARFANGQIGYVKPPFNGFRNFAY